MWFLYTIDLADTGRFKTKEFIEHVFILENEYSRSELNFILIMSEYLLLLKASKLKQLLKFSKRWNSL